MKRIISSTMALILGAVCSPFALAQAFPAKPIRLIVAFPTGGATDTFSRITAAEMTKSVGQQVIVENRPGAGTTIAAEFVSRAPPDGYTLLFTDLSTHTITASLYTKLQYHPLKSFAAVAPVNSSPLLLVAHPSVGAKSVRELVALAKRNPGITFGNSGIGTVTHMTAEKFRLRAGIQVTAVSYKGGSIPVIALLSGEIAMVMATVPASIPYVRQGKLVALGLAAPRRFPTLPDIPTLGETVKDVEGAVFSGVLAPAGTPQNVIERLNAEFAKASDTPQAREIFAANAAEAIKMSPAALKQELERDVKTWAEVVKATGVRVD
ncbi:MAG: tripartite tricarboxylate transporter substrate binding protein [Betaproteobacteria bacterium]|nr:tripartite tricarboxylate transporter substrate binding protein [Betaproteobacteria bacterium]